MGERETVRNYLIVRVRERKRERGITEERGAKRSSELGEQSVGEREMTGVHE